MPPLPPASLRLRARLRGDERGVGLSLVERVTPEMFGRPTAGHEARYALAAGFLRPGDVVVDAACGIGYGALVLDAHSDVTYYGVDRDTSIVAVEEHPRRRFIQADLQAWQPPFEFDVAVG